MDRLKGVAEAHWLEETRVIAILRGVPIDSIVELAGALYKGGIRVLEITMNAPDAPGAIAALREKYGEKMWVGAGTVLDIEKAEIACKAGAQFYVTPNVDEAVIKFGLQNGIPSFTGALTPTEVVKAYKAGASAVKIFPASSVGAHYIKELQGPLSDIPMMAVGGISADNAAEYIMAGCWGIGVGGTLVNRKAIDEKNFDSIRSYAEQLLKVVQEALSK